jgi:hypothetical protein
MKTTRVLGILLISAFATAAGQQDNKAGTTAAQFLKIGVGGRAMGMGGASVGLVDDATAMYWNVSGLTSVNAMTVHATHTRWFADMSHQFFGVVLPVGDDHRLGVNATILNVGEMEITTELEPRGTGTYFKATDVAVGVSYAMRLVDFFSFGATIKYVTQSIYNESGSAIAFDIGTTLRTGYKGITIGMAFTNFGTPMKMEGRDLHKTYDPSPNNATNTGVSSYLATESWDLPVNFRVGIGWELIGRTDAMMIDDVSTLLLGLDANHANDAPENAIVGLEYEWQDILALRGGYHFNDDVRSWSVGTGLHWTSTGTFAIGFDYAYSNLKQLGPIHVFSVALNL